MTTPAFVTKHYRGLLLGAAVLIVYLVVTRKTTKVIGTVDASGEGMILEGDSMADRSKNWGT